MGLLGSIIAKGVATAARNSTIRAVSSATVSVIDAQAKKQNEKPDIVIKNGVTMIKPTRSSDDYSNEDAMDIVHELFGAGFEHVVLKPVHKLKERAYKEYGKIASLSINGKSEFLGVKRVPAYSHIVIEYLDFKTNVSQEAYASVKRITPGTIRRDSEKEMVQNTNKTSSDRGNRYCCYCGAPVTNENAKFCFNCGEKL